MRVIGNTRIMLRKKLTLTPFSFKEERSWNGYRQTFDPCHILDRVTGI